MGFLDSLIGGEKPTEAPEAGAKGKTNPFAVSLLFHPLRLSAHGSNSINLIVKVRNVSSDVQLTSIDALLPKNSLIGFDKPGINKGVEKRLGELKPGEETEVSIPMWANNQTEDGKYEVEVTVFSHYIGYDKVLSYLKKQASFRVV
ncbi:hypothetical protein GF318_06190 [Candidatus Micrarchaeota archaeon]|nr:hypothetical protein [Candidatus Micrarchaeota archaeon]